MSKILYYFVLLPLSWLPFPILYFLSDCLYFVFYYVVAYRKKIVFRNLKNSFPHKTDREITAIAKAHYQPFCDLILESVKAFSISEKEIKKRMICKNTELADKYFHAGQSVILAGGHYNNWELFAVAGGTLLKQQLAAIYKPLHNLFFDAKMRETRGKYGLEMVSTKAVKEFFERAHTKPFAIVFAIDQSPSDPNKAFWTEFLHQDTAVLFGAEKYAKDYNLPVLFARINKEKRGYYSLDLFELAPDDSQTTYGELITKATKMLEQDILDKPEFWLWTHKRWKHKKSQS